MQYLVAYDISDDVRRERAVRVLLDYGPRVQESVFYSEIDEELAVRMVARLRSVLAKEDVLWVVPICRACMKGVITMGPTRVPEVPEFWVF